MPAAASTTITTSLNTTITLAPTTTSTSTTNTIAFYHDETEEEQLQRDSRNSGWNKHNTRNTRVEIGSCVFLRCLVAILWVCCCRACLIGFPCTSRRNRFFPSFFCSPPLLLLSSLRLFLSAVLVLIHGNGFGCFVDTPTCCCCKR